MKTVTRFVSIVFLQGEDAQPVLDLYRQCDIQGAINYMKQWDQGDYGETMEELGYGSSDSIYEDGDYTAAFNIAMDYCSLDLKMIEN